MLAIALLAEVKIGEVEFSGLKIVFGDDTSLSKLFVASSLAGCIILLVFDIGFRYVAWRKSYDADLAKDETEQSAFKAALPNPSKQPNFWPMRLESLLSYGSIIVFYALPFAASFACLLWYCYDRWGA